MKSKNHPTIGNGKISYLEIPSSDIKVSSSFYKEVFGWEIRQQGDGKIAFDDAVNEVSGTWVTDRKPATELGVLIYIMVDNIDRTMKSIISNGGQIIQPVEINSPEVVAKFSDPSGNIFGIFQQ